jgi:hypothetical protein
MLRDPSAEMLTEILGRTLEEAAFVCVEADPSPRRFETTVLVARMGFAGPVAGEMRLAAEPASTASLAANLLGVDLGDPESSGKGRDAIKELLNISCGLLVQEIFGPGVICKLNLPTVAEAPGAEYEMQCAETACKVSLKTEEGWRLDVAVTGQVARGAKAA